MRRDPKRRLVVYGSPTRRSVREAIKKNENEKRLGQAQAEDTRRRARAPPGWRKAEGGKGWRSQGMAILWVEWVKLGTGGRFVPWMQPRRTEYVFFFFF